MFSDDINLLITQTKASINNGDNIKVRNINSIKESFWIMIPMANAPKKVLPTSPINIFAGLQFQIKNPIKDVNNGKIDDETSIEATNKKIAKFKATIPSIPSMKFIKFINTVKKIRIKINKKEL